MTPQQGYTPGELADILTPFFCRRDDGCGVAVLDYGSALATQGVTTTSAVDTDMPNMSVSVTVVQNALILIVATGRWGNDGAGNYNRYVITDSANVYKSTRLATSQEVANSYVPMGALHGYDAVVAGTHTYKLRWSRNAGTVTVYDREMKVIAFSR